MATELLRDSRGSIIGKIETLANGEEIIRDSRGHICGRYDPKTNKTRDDRGSIVSTGNTLTRLI